MRRRLKQTADFCRWSLYLTIVLAAIFLLLARLLISQLYFYQTQIESYLSDSLSTYVSADQARGVWDNIYPVIELEYLRVGQNQVDPGLRASYVRAEPNYLESIRLQTAIWEELSILDLSIELNQQQDGSWSIAGISTGSTDDASLSAAQKLVDMLFRSRSIDIQNLSLEYIFQDSRSVNLSFSEVRVENDSNFHRISLNGQVDSDQNGIAAIIELTGTDYRFENMQGQAYLALSGADMTNLFSSLLGGNENPPTALPVLAEGELWFSIEKQAQIQMQGNVKVADLSLQQIDGLVSLESNLWGERTDAGHWRLDLVDLSMAFADQNLEGIDLSLQSQTQGLRILSEQIALTDLTQRALSIGFASDNLVDMIERLNPRGDLTSAALNLYRHGSNYRWSVEGNLESVYSQSYGGIPRLENLKSYFFADQDGGEFLIDSIDTSVHFDRLFNQKIFNRQLQGQVGWRLNRDSGELHVYSSDIDSTNEFGAQGISRFHLITPIVSGDFASDFTLVSGLKNGSASYWPLYLPSEGNDRLIQWFEDSAIEGDLSQVGFIYRGYIRNSPEYPKTVQLMGDLKNAELEFAPGWPRLSNLDSRFGLSDRLFYNHSPLSQLQGVTLVDSRVEINISDEPRLSTSALLEGNLNDILDLARQTPVRSKLGDSLDLLEFAGDAQVNFRLEQPLANDISYEQIQLGIESRLSDISLRLEPIDLSIDSISGTVVFDQNGLRSDSILAELWGNPIEAVISTNIETAISIVLDSQVEIAAIQEWISDPFINHLSGTARIQGELLLPYNSQQHTHLLLRSNSVGISTDLPEPLAKDAATERPLSLSFSAPREQGAELELVWGGELNLSMDINQSGTTDAIAFGLASLRPEKESGRLLGNLNLQKFDYLEWQPFIQSDTSADLSLAPQIDISSEETWFSGIDVGPSLSRILLYQGDLEVGFSTDFGEGRFVWERNNQDSPHRLTFNWLDIAQFPGVSDYFESTDRLETQLASDLDGTADRNIVSDVTNSFDPRDFPSMTLDLVELKYGERDLGQWFFQVEPHELGLSLSNIQSRFAGAEIAAESMSSLQWGYNGADHLTELEIQISVGDVGDVFEQFGESRAVTSQDGIIDVHLGWLGVPWQPSMQELSGTLDVLLNDGKFDAEADGDELLKLIALFSIDNWGRRLKFDFSDITEDGTGYRSFRGNFGVENGLLNTLSPVQISLITGSLRFSGDIDLIENQVDAELVATLPVRNNLAWVTAAFMGIPAAAGVWLFGELFKDELDSMASVTYLVTGDIESPDIDARSAADANSAASANSSQESVDNPDSL